MGGVKIEIDIKAGNPFETKATTTALKDLAKLDSDVLSKLAELSKNKNAIEQIKTNFPMIKGFLAN